MTGSGQRDRGVGDASRAGPGPGPEMLQCFGHRPVAWLRAESEFQPSPELLRQAENLTEGDREAVPDFAEFLQGTGPAPAMPEPTGSLSRYDLITHRGSIDAKS